MLLGILPLVLLELGLRLIDDPVRESIDNDPVVNLVGGRSLFVQDVDRDRWTIAKERMNFFRPDSFAAKKPDGGKRIFVLGGSTVQGRPYATETAFSTWLRLRLQANSPNAAIEVVNCGGVSYASYRVAKILDEVLKHQPDAIVLYTGHNEFLESRSYAGVRAMSTSQQQVAQWGSRLSTVRWLRRWFEEWLAPDTNQKVELAGEVDARLDHAGGLAAYHRDAQWVSDVEQHFSITLRQMAATCQSARVPLVICVPASDLVNTPPFKIQTRSTLDTNERAEFESFWQLATSDDATSEPSQRRMACEQCFRLDAEHAGANYLLGRWAYDQGDVALAREHLTQARDHDVCPLRATSAIIQSTLDVIEEFGLASVDVSQVLDLRNCHGAKVPDSIADPEMFVDHVHPSIVGHQRIAEAIATQLQVVPNNESQSRYEQACAAHLQTLSEAYYARGKQRLEGLRNWAAGRAVAVGEPF